MEEYSISSERKEDYLEDFCYSLKDLFEEEQSGSSFKLTLPYVDIDMSEDTYHIVLNEPSRIILKFPNGDIYTYKFEVRESLVMMVVHEICDFIENKYGKIWNEY